MIVIPFSVAAIGCHLNLVQCVGNKNDKEKKILTTQPKVLRIFKHRHSGAVETMLHGCNYLQIKPDSPAQ